MRAESGGREARRRFRLTLIRKDFLMLFGCAIFAFFILMALLAPIIAPYSPSQILTDDRGKILSNLPPSGRNLLGTTPLGQDIFSQLIYGSQSALIVGVAAGIMVSVIGTAVGLVSGFFGGQVDNVLMWLTDISFGIPFLPVVILLAAYFGGSTLNVILAVGLLLWRDAARPIRSQVLELREQEFVQVAQVAGASSLRTMFVHIAPNVFPLSMLYAALSMGWAILTEASVSFLGLGSSTTIIYFLSSLFSVSDVDLRRL